MRIRSLLMCFLMFLPLAPVAAHARTTPTEAAAIAAAQQDHTAYTLPPGKLAQSNAIRPVRMAVSLGEPLWAIVSLFLLLQLGIVARMRDAAIRLSRNRWAQGFGFTFLFALTTTLLMLPIDMFEQHIHLVYGMSVQRWGSWFGDQAVGFGLLFLIGGLGVVLLHWIIRKSPRRWWLWLWFPAMGSALLAVFATPYVIDPLFNKFEPLTKTNPALVAQLEQVVAKGQGIQIPPERMFLMHASAKVTTLNAYVTGFGASKRVVVWDTSIQHGTPDEVLFIFGHEMGHYVLGHILRGIEFYFVLILVLFFLGFHLFQFLLARFGSTWNIPDQNDWGAIAVFVLVMITANFLAGPITSAQSRMQEHAADVYGQEVIHGLVASPQASAQHAFDLLGESSLANPDPSPLVEFWTGSHPPIWFRAAFAKHYDPWAIGEAPKYFVK